MKTIDIFRLALQNLQARKLRTGLNLIGIVMGCVLILCTLSATHGIRIGVERFLEQADESLQIQIYSDYDQTIEPPEGIGKIDAEMSPRRAERMRKALINQWREENLPRPYLIQAETFKKLREHPLIADVAPGYSVICAAEIGDQKMNATISAFSFRNRRFQERVIAGQVLTSETPPNGIMINEFLAYRLGYRSDLELEQLIGTSITIRTRKTDNLFTLIGESFFQEDFDFQASVLKVVDHVLNGRPLAELDSEEVKQFREYVRRRQDQEAEQKTESNQAVTSADLPTELVATVVGVFRRSDSDDPTSIFNELFHGGEDLLIHHWALEPLVSKTMKGGWYNGNVFIDDVRELDAVVEFLEQQPLNVVSAAGPIRRIIDGVDRWKVTLMAIVAIVFFISAIGISNTMIISLIERTEEIGILKSIGASNGSVLKMILMEGFLTGLLAAFVSILISFGVAELGNGILQNYFRERTSIELQGRIFMINGLMLLTCTFLALLVTTLASLWPAWRASRLDPVVAMRKS